MSKNDKAYVPEDENFDDPRVMASLDYDADLSYNLTEQSDPQTLRPPSDMTPDEMTPDGMTAGGAPKSSKFGKLGKYFRKP